MTVDKTVELGGLNISRLDLSAALEQVSERIAARRGGYVCFVNTHTLTEATRDESLRAALAGATYRFADGQPLLWLAAAKGAAIGGRVCGPDFMQAMLQRVPTTMHGFVGGAPGTAARIAARFGVPSIEYAPPMRAFSPDAALEDWRRFVSLCPDHEPPPIAWIGLGAPKQERWMATVTAIAPRTMLFGVGAAFDFLAGLKPRAPRALQVAGLEWAHRLASEPRRLWKRYLVSSSRFIRMATAEIRAHLTR